MAGAMAVGTSLVSLPSTPPDWIVLALLTLLSGSATIKLPSLPATISVSETFVFTSLLLFGVPAATLTVALDTLVISFWSYKRGDPLYKIVFNIFALPLTIWTAAQILLSLSHYLPHVTQLQPLFKNTNIDVTAVQLFVPLFVLAATYFLLNSWIITIAIVLERGGAPGRIWRDNFLKLSLNYIAGASVATLLVSYTRNVDFGYLALIVPLLLALYFTYSSAMGRVADANKHLSQLNTLYMSTIETLAMAIDAKDQITHGHIRRVQGFALHLAHKMGVSNPFLISAIEAAALLHDMGKLAVPEYILNKPGPLTAAEFEKMKLHAAVGADILSSIDFPYPVVPIVRHHHENWDGTGYPDGLKGTQIPIGARILAVVDCFDALTSDRPYRPKLPDQEAIDILLARRGTMYDPLVVDAFMEIHSQLQQESPQLTTAPSFRAIADASHPTTPIESQRGPLDDISASGEEMLTLFDLARGLTGQVSTQDAADLIAKHVRRLVPYSTCAFFIYRVETHELLAAHVVGTDAELLQNLRFEVGQRLSGWVAAHRKSIRNSNPILDLGKIGRTSSPRLRSALSTPLLSHGRLVGVLSLYATGVNAFTEEHQRVLEAVSGQVSAILETAVAREVQQRRSLRDAVTGLPNLNHLSQVFELDDAKSLGEMYSVLIIEIPFPIPTPAVQSEVSPASQQGLRGIVKVIRAELRSADLLFHYREQRFVALLLNTGRDIRTAVEHRLGSSLLSYLGMTGSDIQLLAAASAPEDGGSVRALLDIANIRLRKSLAQHRWPENDRGVIH
ncbi:MAG TPA: HD domain-containing phosphohydrolase [Vicinamibacterales bacterium]|nr:HD domain-containing phosphohydrolase [Vicinamibacterales bacterium]